MIGSARFGNLACILLGSAVAVAATAAAAQAGDSAPRIDPSYSNPQPPYPDAAQVNGEQGDVILEVKVGDNGKVRQIHVAGSSGFPDLDNAAVEGVLRWHFVPAVRDGDTETEWTKVKITYHLPTAIAVPQGVSAHG